MLMSQKLTMGFDQVPEFFFLYRLATATHDKMHSFLSNGQDWCHWKCSYSAGNNFMRVYADLCDRKCSYTAGTNFMRVYADLCDRKFSCQNLNRNVQSTSVSTVMTHHSALHSQGQSGKRLLLASRGHPIRSVAY